MAIHRDAEGSLIDLSVIFYDEGKGDSKELIGQKLRAHLLGKFLNATILYLTRPDTNTLSINLAADSNYLPQTDENKIVLSNLSAQLINVFAKRPRSPDELWQYITKLNLDTFPSPEDQYDYTIQEWIDGNILKGLGYTLLRTIQTVSW